jgi:hypothetical protein
VFALENTTTKIIVIVVSVVLFIFIRKIVEFNERVALLIGQAVPFLKRSDDVTSSDRITVYRMALAVLVVIFVFLIVQDLTGFKI